MLNLGCSSESYPFRQMISNIKLIRKQDVDIQKYVRS